ncbi:hypothetical protein ABK040_002335 [Willaertia magna]
MKTSNNSSSGMSNKLMNEHLNAQYKGGIRKVRKLVRFLTNRRDINTNEIEQNFSPTSDTSSDSDSTSNSQEITSTPNAQTLTSTSTLVNGINDTERLSPQQLCKEMLNNIFETFLYKLENSNTPFKSMPIDSNQRQQIMQQLFNNPNFFKKIQENTSKLYFMFSKAKVNDVVHDVVMLIANVIPNQKTMFVAAFHNRE